MKTSPAKLYGLISVMTLIWSWNYVAAKIALRWWPPLLVGTLRAAAAAVMLAPIYFWHSRGSGARDEPWTFRELGVLALLGIFGITLNQVLFVVGMQRTSVAHGALLIATGPLVVLLLAALRRQEKITPRKLAGMAVAFGGIAMLQLGPGRDLHGATPLGDLFVFLAAFCFAVYTVFGKEIAAHHDPITVNTVGYFAGAVAGAPLLWQQSKSFEFAAVPAMGWWAIIYMGALSSVAAYLIFSYALHRLPASRVAAFSYAQPVLAALAGLAILAEPITVAVAGGGLMVLGGVWVTGRK